MGATRLKILKPDSGKSGVNDRRLVLLFGRFLSPYWRRVILVFLLLIAITALSLLPPYLIQRAVDGPIHDQNLSALLPYGIVYFIIILCTFILRFSQTYVLQSVGQDALLNLRQTLFEHILKQDMGYFNQTPIGQLVSRLSNDVVALTELLSTSIVTVASNLVTLMGIIVVMILLNWRL